MSGGPAARRLIVNADDFGLTGGVSRGILRAHREGLVTSTTVLASLPAQPELDAMAAASPGLGLGLHFNLTWGRPVSPAETVASLVDADGRFGRDLAVLRERARPDEVRRECEAQIEAFTRRFGRGPTHLDSHHHAHRVPRVMDAVVDVVVAARVPAAEPGRGLPRRPAPPRHRHDGLVRRRRAGRALLDDRAPAGPARHAAARCHRAHVPSGRLRRDPRLQPLRAPARGRAGGPLRSRGARDRRAPRHPALPLRRARRGRMRAPATEIPLVELRGVTKAYREGDAERVVLRGVDATIRRGELCVLIGRSGSGKSTLLNLIGGIDVPTAGEIVVDGLPLARATEATRTLFRRHHVGFVFQFFNLIPTLTVEENLRLPLELNGRPRDAARARAGALLAEVGLADRGAGVSRAALRRRAAAGGGGAGAGPRAAAGARRRADGEPRSRHGPAGARPARPPHPAGRAHDGDGDAQPRGRGARRPDLPPAGRPPGGDAGSRPPDDPPPRQRPPSARGIRGRRPCPSWGSRSAWRWWCRSTSRARAPGGRSPCPPKA